MSEWGSLEGFGKQKVEAVHDLHGIRGLHYKSCSDWIFTNQSAQGKLND